MKARFFTALFMGIALWSCDKIEDPYPKAFSEGAECTTQEFELVTSAPLRVLLEDYTGHQCGNCPDAADEAKRLEDKYGEQLVSIAVHAGFFARVRPTEPYNTDFSCPTSVKWDTDFSVSAIGNPNGMVNRVTTGGQRVKGISEWDATIQTILATKQATMEINLFGNINDEDSTLCGQIFVQPLSNLDPSKDYRFNLVVLEDSIVDWQKDYRLPSGEQDNPNYVHNHVLRQSFVGPEGVSIDLASITSASYLSFGYQIPLNEKWRKKKLSIVGFVFDNDSKEVLQTRKLKLEN